ncbi:acyl-CoA N-acyltransferase [Lophiotrema nucula]|uniref:Acyl-CoA N-acyltransferase n=1 Tax=Lophiotrema nucula TaxID=690887 RepID=A0A6A5ZTM4_9PLEO|nr:acyl-CoA N-acyltransferase [Lophiotrema nucula]
MPIRPAKFTEIPNLASISSAAFFDEDLFGRVMHPNRHQYPEDFKLFWLAWMRDHWYDWRHRFFVAYTEDEKSKDGTITGFAVWERQGEGAKKMELWRLDPRTTLRPLAKFTNTLTTYISPNRALDPTKANILSRSMPFCAHHWAGERSDNWYLSLLAVHPDYQGQGFGRELVAWGIREADAEGVHASVLSSEGNDKFYLTCGFEEVVGNACTGEGNPLGFEGVKGGSILFRFPKGA